LAPQGRDEQGLRKEALPGVANVRALPYLSRMPRPFHLAFPVHDLAAARTFYGTTLGCPEGRSSDSWIDFDLFGHQIVAHLDPAARAVAVENAVDGHHVPVPHFGVVLTMADWQALSDRVSAAGVRFGIEPHIRFKGQAGEQATMFFYDPSGNALEFKAFGDDAMLFATEKDPA
jgi:extradiol dioxygenase family protein